MEIKTEINIKASPNQVWKVLTDFNNYSNWNPFIKQIEGTLKVGKKLKAVIQAPESSAMTFKPTVMSYKENKEFSWLGHLLFKGIFDGLHKFELIDNQDGSTTLIQSEIFEGILVPLFKKQLRVNTKNGFHAMNDKLKELCE
jgi:hypothetical protein